MMSETHKSRIELPRTIVNQILSHAQHNPEQEICGLIAARDGIPEQVYRIDNSAAQPQKLFEMDPEQQIDAMRNIRESGEELFAIYHSHPHSPALPSATDLHDAAYPDTLYLIVSLDTKGVLQMKGFYLDANKEQVEAVDLGVV